MEYRERIYIAHRESNSDKMECLAKSLVGELFQTLDYKFLIKKIECIFEGVSSVKFSSSYKVFIIF